MTRAQTLALLLLAGCADSHTSAGPPAPSSLTVTTSVTLTARFRQNVYYGCDVLWRARASEDTTLIGYSIATGNYDRNVQPWPPITGSFRDSTRVAFAIDTSGIVLDPHTVSWDIQRVRGDSLVASGSARIRQDLNLYPNCWR